MCSCTNALIVEGGAFRSIYSAGLLDGFLKHQFNPFDLLIGTSAGAINLLFYLNRQKEESSRLLFQAIEHPGFFSVPRFLGGGHLINLDQLFDQFSDLISLQDVPIGKSYVIGLTEVNTGLAHYCEPDDIHLLPALKATMALPLLYRGFVPVNGQPMSDGGIANGLPIEEAIRRGARKIMVVRSRHRDYSKTDSLFHRYIRWKHRHCQSLHHLMQQRIAIHERNKQLISNPPDGIQIIDVCPPRSMEMDRFSRDRDQLKRAYREGMIQASRAIRQWHQRSQVATSRHCI